MDRIDHAHKESPSARRYQFRLKSIFVVTTVTAFLCGYIHYLGILTILRFCAFCGIAVLLLLMVTLVPLVVTELLIVAIDRFFGLSTQAPLPGRRRFE
jgi:hypothetical protein